MHITILGPAHPLRGGGISTFNERLAGALQTVGHRVVIESFSLQYPGFLFPGKSQFTDEPPPPGLTIRSDLSSINPLSWRRVGRRIRAEAPDLLIVRYWLPFMGPCLGTVLRIAKKNKKTRVICIADNLVPHEARPGDAAFTRYFLKPVDGLITMSREVQKDAARLAPTKPARYTPHPLYDTYGPAIPREEACTILGLDPAKKYVLFFGFIRAYKGLDLLLEALAGAGLEDVHCIIAGEYYDDRARYEPLIAALGDRVHPFTEFIPNDEVARYFSAADLVVQPYRSATQSGITGAAYHFGKPMVVTDVGGLAETVPDGQVGYVVPPRPASIAAAIGRFFMEEGKAERMAAAVREEAKKFSWEVFSDVLMEMAGVAHPGVAHPSVAQSR